MVAIFNSLIENVLKKQSNEKHLAIFCKALYGFLVLKIIFQWPLVGDLLHYKSFTYNSFLGYLLFAPLILTKIHNYLFFLIFLALLIVSLFLKINYWTAIVISWFSISLSRLFLPIINGSDLVLNLFLLIAIFFPDRPKLPLKNGEHMQIIVSNIALLIAQLQFALIYLLSGYDKLTSTAWRSGAAIDSINHLKFYHNPFFTFELNETSSLLLSWMVILFELAFAFLIWFKPFRTPLLIAGVLFHLVIFFVLGLFDFALVMIICYGVFLPFKKSESHSIWLGN